MVFKLKNSSIELWLGLVIIILSVFFALNTDSFFTIRNLLDLAESYSVMGIFALGLFVVLVTGGIDISFAAIASSVQYIVATFAMKFGFSDPTLGIVAAMFLGLMFGFINATLIYYFNIVSIIITISMQSVLFGLLMWLTNGINIYNLPEWMMDFYHVIPFTYEGVRYQIGLPFLTLIILSIISWFLLKKTNIGRQLYATGGSVESARRVGVNVAFIHFFAYGWCGVMAAIGGLVQIYRVNEVVPSALVGTELDVLAAVVLGGSSLSGGKGSVFGTIMGVFCIGILKNGLNLIGVSNYFSNVVIGSVILIAITVTHFGKRQETNFGFS
ncbi:ABC transporter permease [Vibrio sp. S12_S33]|uniref:ABC transporter permease n=1 Tax=Vibrio sp. S12_S33 TaxID=2720223 RepID=UPI00192DA6CC|nr:ABC transporter permease [Vibrio sp. S12_S33]